MCAGKVDLDDRCRDVGRWGGWAGSWPCGPAGDATSGSFEPFDRGATGSGDVPGRVVQFPGNVRDPVPSGDHRCRGRSGLRAVSSCAPQIANHCWTRIRGMVAAVFTGLLVVGEDRDFQLFGPFLVAVGLFAGIFVLFGVGVGIAAERSSSVTWQPAATVRSWVTLVGLMGTAGAGTILLAREVTTRT